MLRERQEGAAVQGLVNWSPDGGCGSAKLDLAKSVRLTEPGVGPEADGFGPSE